MYRKLHHGSCGYKPYEFVRRDPAKRNTMDATAVNVYDDDQFTIERNEEHPPGNLARRDLTLEELQGPPPKPQPENLRNCLVDGSLDMLAAARIIQWDKKQRRFSQGSYEEFIRFAGSFGINRFQFDAFKEIESCEEFRALVTDALQLMLWIAFVKVSKCWNFSTSFMLTSSSAYDNSLGHLAGEIGGLKRSYSLLFRCSALILTPLGVILMVMKTVRFGR
ncbi:unnamed protein product [Heligmosomoides polygyrus]|uniref:GP-PDE domain-containing protein n=1 Tax=Heligmosomoides polygyrus TaxID=6339 RepID=A0A183F5K3_HELPZ|nr:unnamed protein product [Heligmosomoides polygyrus]